MNATFDQTYQLIQLLKDQKPNSEMMNRLFGSGLLSDLLESTRACGEVDREKVRRSLCLPPKCGEITVDYRRSVAEMNEAGPYDFISPMLRDVQRSAYNKFEAEEFLPKTKKGVKTISFQTIHRNALPNFGLGEWLDKQHLRRANRAELQAFAEEFSYVADRFCVYVCFETGLGTNCVGFAPCAENKKGLVYALWNHAWPWDNFAYLLAVETR
jgi:hypothetical protein